LRGITGSAPFCEALAQVGVNIELSSPSRSALRLCRDNRIGQGRFRLRCTRRSVLAAKTRSRLYAGRAGNVAIGVVGATVSGQGMRRLLANVSSRENGAV